MTGSPRLVRAIALLAIAVIAVMVFAAILFESGQAPIEYVLRGFGWPALIAAIPLIYLAIELTRGPSQRALALGIAYPLVIIIAFVLILQQRFNSGTEGSMDVVYSLVFFWFNIVWAIFLVVFMPTMMCLLLASVRAYWQLPRRRVLPVFAWIIVLLLLQAIAWGGRLSGTTPDADVPQYRPDVVDNLIEPLNECIWGVAGRGAEKGFPDSLRAVLTAWYRPLQNDGNKFPNRCIERFESIENAPVDVEYSATDRDAAGRNRAFVIRLIEKTRPGGRPRVTWIDQTGLRRQGIRNQSGGVDSVRIIAGSVLPNFLILQHFIDEYGVKNGGTYPRRIFPDWKFRDGQQPPADALVLKDVGECFGFDDDVASCIERWERQIVYTPIMHGVGPARAYTLAMLPQTYYDNVQQQPFASRTHFRDADGSLHSFGGLRPATPTDPPPDSVELAKAQADLQDFLKRQR